MLKAGVEAPCLPVAFEGEQWHGNLQNASILRFPDSEV